MAQHDTTATGHSEHRVHTAGATWRDFADELADHQRQKLESTEEAYRELGVDDTVTQRDLLPIVVAFVNANRIDADHAHVPLPPGATLVPGEGWASTCDEPHIYSRPVMWRAFEVGVDNVRLEISGRQSTDGSFTRQIQWYGDCCPLGGAEARQLAAALAVAADELDQLCELDQL